MSGRSDRTATETPRPWKRTLGCTRMRQPHSLPSTSTPGNNTRRHREGAGLVRAYRSGSALWQRGPSFARGSEWLDEICHAEPQHFGTMAASSLPLSKISFGVRPPCWLIHCWSTGGYMFIKARVAVSFGILSASGTLNRRGRAMPVIPGGGFQAD